MEDKKFATQRQVSEAKDEMSGDLLAFQNKLGFDAPIVELGINWLECITGINPVGCTVTFKWRTELKIEQLHLLKDICDKASQLAADFPYRGWYIQE